MHEERIAQHPVLDVPKDEGSVDFTFNGKALKARPGEMVSSAAFRERDKGLRAPPPRRLAAGHFLRNGSAPSASFWPTACR